MGACWGKIGLSFLLKCLQAIAKGTVAVQETKGHLFMDMRRKPGLSLFVKDFVGKHPELVNNSGGGGGQRKK